jgi:uncharacterized protein (DUF924 family)
MDRQILCDIHAYWFGDLKSADDFPAEKSKIWFERSDATDEHIRATFGGFIDEAAAADWRLDDLDRREQIALVVLLDQFPRNIFRDSGRSFAHDAIARTIARKLLAGGRENFFWIERQFLYLPFEHSEGMADQNLSTFLFAELAVEAPASLRDYFSNILDFATRHRDIIRKFGRFPHRNALLGRQSTPEEAAFFAEHGRGY